MLSKYFKPNFLQRLDTWLLTHRPQLWRTKTHFVVFYGGIVALILFILGFIYPQNLHDSLNNRSTNPAIYADFLCAFGLIAAVSVWAFQIQKFGFRRTAWRDMVNEIGLYSVGLFVLWTAAWAFHIGFFYHRAYHLEKGNVEQNRAWLLSHNFLKPAYVPHFQANKLDNLPQYFKNGQLIHDKMLERRRKIWLEKSASNNTEIPNYLESYPHADFGELYEWEKLYPPTYKVPPQYKNPSNYLNDVLTSDSLFEIESRKVTGQDFGNLSQTAFILNFEPYWSVSEQLEVNENIYSRLFSVFDLSDMAEQRWEDALRDWTYYRQFLTTMTPKEQRAYLNYLNYLTDLFKSNNLPFVYVYETAVLEELKSRYLSYPNADYPLGSFEYILINNIGTKYLQHELSEDKQELAANKLEVFLKSLSQTALLAYLEPSETTPQYFNAYPLPELNAPLRTQFEQYFKQKFPQPTLQDSLLFYNYWVRGKVNVITNFEVLRHEFAKYYEQSTPQTQFDSLRNVLTINGFPTVDNRNKSLQNWYLVNQLTDLEQGINSRSTNQKDFEEMRLALFSWFSWWYCLFAAVIFYIVIQSNGVQFWTGLFIGGSLVAFLSFLVQITISASSSILANVFGGFFLLVFAVLIVALLRARHQWRWARQVVNTIAFSGISSVFVSILYWSSSQSPIVPFISYTYQNGIIPSAIIIGFAIFIYLLIAWLYKRHLILPRKR